MGITAELAAWVATVQLDDIPDPVLERVKVHLLDALATGYVGTHLSWSQIVFGLVIDEGGRHEASLFGSREKVAAPQAALVNGVYIGGYEANHSGHLTHSAATVTPAALAMAERQRSSGAQLLLALAAGTEAGCRVGYAQTRAVEDERGFHNPTVNGPLAAATAAGKLLGLDAIAQAWALGIASSVAGGLVEYAWRGAMTKRLHPGLVSRGGLESAVLASKGFTGPMSAIEGGNGLLQAFSPSPRPERVLAELGATWHLVKTMIKGYPCHGIGQPIAAAITELKGQKPIESKSVKQLHIRTNDGGHTLKPRFLDRRPTNHMAAQCSLPYIAAVALVRDLDDPLQFDESVLDDPEIRRVAELVTWEEIPAGADDPPYLEIDVTTGSDVLHALGGPYRGSVDNPASMDDIADKFHRYTRNVLTAEQRDLAISLVKDLEHVADAGELIRLLAVTQAGG